MAASPKAPDEEISTRRWETGEGSWKLELASHCLTLWELETPKRRDMDVIPVPRR